MPSSKLLGASAERLTSPASAPALMKASALRGIKKRTAANKIHEPILILDMSISTGDNLLSRVAHGKPTSRRKSFYVCARPYDSGPPEVARAPDPPFFSFEERMTAGP